MSKLYSVTIEFEAVVLAESEQDAVRWADQNIGEITTNDPPLHVHAAATGNRLPPGWEAGCVPWNSGDDRTVGDHMRQATPTADPDAG